MSGSRDDYPTLERLAGFCLPHERHNIEMFEEAKRALDEIARLRSDRDSWTRLEEQRRDLIGQIARDDGEIARDDGEIRHLCDIIERARAKRTFLATQAILDEVDE